MSKLKGRIVDATRVQDTDLGRVIGKSLRSLREVAGVTQIELAARLDVGQAAISKIEHRGDVQISSLRKYVEALGATLRIGAEFSREAGRGLNFASVFDSETQTDDQLVFPIFEDELFRPARDVVLSVRPQYSEKIFSGKKKIELRRRFPVSAPRGTLAYIYSTSPVRAMVGSAEIENVWKLPILEIWKKYGSQAQIEKPDFDKYFSGINMGFAIKLKGAHRFTRPLELSELRNRFGFEPPQSFLYADPLLRTALKNEYSVVPD